MIFLLMYSLVGSQLYAGKLNQRLGFRQNFDNFYFSFLSVFQVLTLTNWTDVEFLTLNSEVYRGITMLFLVSLMIIGNYVFLNLFIGILINGFVEKSKNAMEDDGDEEENEALDKLKKEEEEEKLKLLKLQEEYEDDEIIAELFTKKSKVKILFEGVACDDSLYIFSKHLKIRRILYKIVGSTNFETLILVIIIISSIKLALDTYDLLGDSSQPIDMVLNYIFLIESVFKIISYGFFFDEGSYLRNGWNILDFFIVAISIIDMSVTDLNLSFQKVLL